jgi:hypothetical protein
MWKEDPRWQQAHYKVVIYAIGIFALLIPLVSLFSGDWEITRTYFLILGILAAAVCLYDALVWVAVRVVLFVISLCKRLLHRGR